MKYQVVSGYVLREFLEEYLLIPVDALNAQNTNMGILNATGQFLWQQLQQARTEKELTAALCSAFDVDEQAAAEDVQEFLDLLSNHHCIVKMEE